MKKQYIILTIALLSILTSCSKDKEDEITRSLTESLIDGEWVEAYYKQDSYTKEGELIPSLSIEVDNGRMYTINFIKSEGKMHDNTSPQMRLYEIIEDDGKVFIETRSTFNNELAKRIQVLSISETNLRTRIESPIALEGKTIILQNFKRK